MGPGWRQRPRTFAPQASVMAAGVRDDVGHEYTCFMRGGEDARLHERFSGKGYPHSAKPSRREDLDIEEPVACRYSPTFYFHATLPGMLGSTLIWAEVIPTVSPLIIPLVYCHINGFQRAFSVEKPLPGGENRMAGWATHPMGW